MPPIAGKVKNKGREGRQSRSRNTTPSSTVSLPLAHNTAYLEIPIADLAVPTNINYDDILERHGGAGGIPDPEHLQTMANDLATLSKLAATRSETCNSAMRELSRRRNKAMEEERRREQAARAREAEDREREKELVREKEKEMAKEKEREREKEIEVEKEREKVLNKEAEDEGDITFKKGVKLKKRKDQSNAREERPPNHGAHGLARQDGLNLPLKGMLTSGPAASLGYHTRKDVQHINFHSSHRVSSKHVG